MSSNPTLLHGARLREDSIDQTKLTAEIRTMLAEIADKANTADLIGGDNKLLTSLLPDSVLGAMVPKGLWDAATNTPAIPAASESNKGHYYKVKVSGTTAIDGIAEWAVGDWIVSDGTVWDKIDNSEKTEEALTTHFDKTVKNLLQSSTVQGAIDELAVNSGINLGGSLLGNGVVVDFAVRSNNLANFVVGYAQEGLFGPITAGKSILCLDNGLVYAVQASGLPVAIGGDKGLTVYKVKNAAVFGSDKIPCGYYLVHVNDAGAVKRSRIVFDDMIFDSLTQKTVKQKILDLDSNALLAARLIRRAAVSGVVDGVNKVFTLVGKKLIADTEDVRVDGMDVYPDDDYVLTESGADTVLTFTVAPPVGSRIRVSGIKA